MSSTATPQPQFPRHTDSRLDGVDRTHTVAGASTAAMDRRAASREVPAQSTAQHARRVRYRITSDCEPARDASGWRHAAFFLLDAVSESCVACVGRRVCASPWRVLVKAADLADPPSSSEVAPGEGSRAGGTHRTRTAPPHAPSCRLSLLPDGWRLASREQARPLLQEYRSARRESILRVCFACFLLLLCVVLLLVMVLTAWMLVTPRQPPSPTGSSSPLAVIWMWQVTVLDALRVLSLPHRQEREPYNPGASPPPLSFQQQLKAFDWELSVSPVNHSSREHKAEALRFGELHGWLATLRALDAHAGSAAPPPLRSASWVGALASFLRGDAHWGGVVRSHEAHVGRAAVDVTPADASVKLRVQRVRDGYAHATGTDVEEAEVRRPMDDVSLLLWRHALNARTQSGGVPATAAEMAAAKVRLYQVSSVLNRRFYYPLRRLERAAPYTSASTWTTGAWYEAVAGSALWGVYGADDGDVAGASLHVDDLSASWIREIEQYESHRDLLPPRTDARADVPTVFVSLASYRDAECAPTLVDLFRKAKNARRVYVGLAEQNLVGDGSCLAPLALHEASACFAPVAASDASVADTARVSARVFGGAEREGSAPLLREFVDDFRRGVCVYADHVRVRRIDAGVAKGPTYGRYMAMLLYRGESLTIVLDSHNRFTPFWDTLATHQYRRYQDPKAVLSHYPAPLPVPMTSSFTFWQRDVAYLCRAYFLIKLGFVRLDAAMVSDPQAHAQNNDHNQPFIFSPDGASGTGGDRSFRLPQPWVAGGFLFGNSSIMREVPFDPHLPFVFDGEEALYSVRLWTHGYNMYSPVHNIAYHYYLRAKAARVFDAPSGKWVHTQAVAQDRIRFLLHSRQQPGVDALRVPANTSSQPVVVDLERFGTGKARRVDQWYTYAGVDPVSYNVDGRWCAPHMYADHKVLERAEKRKL